MSLLAKRFAEEILLYLPQMQSDDADETILLQGKVDDGRTKRGGRRDGVTISMRAALPKAGTLPFRFYPLAWCACVQANENPFCLFVVAFLSSFEHNDALFARSVRGCRRPVGVVARSII